MPYVQANTANHLGWRTLSGDSQFGGGRFLARVTTLGQGPPPYSTEYLNSLIAANLVDQAGVDAVMRGEISLDDAMAAYQPVGTVVPQLPTQAAWYDLLGQLQQTNEELKILEAGIHDYPSLGPEISSARNTYSGYASEFQRIYTLAFGQPAAGLDGMGSLGIDLLTAAAVAASFLFLLSAAGAFYAYVVKDLAPRAEAARIAAQAQLTSVQSSAALAAELRRQAAIAQNAGDAEGARALLNQALIADQQAGTTAQVAGFPQGLAQWFMDNAKWIGLFVAAVYLGQPLIKKL